MGSKTIKFMAIILILIFLTGCSGFTKNRNGELTASGTITAREVNISPETAGVVREILATESDTVKAGDVLVRLDTTLLQAQMDSSTAAMEIAAANVKAAEASLAAAQVQHQQVLTAAHQQDALNRVNLWKKGQPDEVDLPGWYFAKPERLASAEQQVESARENLEAQKTNLEQEIKTLNLPALQEIEKRLADAEAAFKTAKSVLDLANNAADQQELRNAAQDQYDAVKDALNAVEQEFNDLLTDDQYDDLLEARALAALAQQTYDEALDRYYALLSADDSMQVKSAEAAVNQAQAAVDQANAALEQAKAASAVFEVQLAKTVLSAPISGTILTRNVEPGEMASPGGTLLVIGELATVNLTVYIPEDRYGEVMLGQQVSISVDSFPGETFTGAVTHIADQAEFTPRNVQSVDGRLTTVYAVEIEVPNPDLKLKPGMPADAVFK